MKKHTTYFTNWPLAGKKSGELDVRRRWHEVSLLVGSNIAPEKNLTRAIQLLDEVFPIEKVSSVWETPAVGSSGPDFLNLAVLVRTSLDPQALKDQILRPIEARLGRVRTPDKFAPRTVDIDIITYDGQLLDENLWKYAYRAVPVSELLPWFHSEKSGETLHEAARRLSHTTPIKLRSDVLVAERG